MLKSRKSSAASRKSSATSRKSPKPPASHDLGISSLLQHLQADEFKHIKSIGFEFEAHHLSKLVLDNDGRKYYAADTSTKDRNKRNTRIDIVDGKEYRRFNDHSEFLCDKTDEDEEFCIYSDVPDKTPPIYTTHCDANADSSGREYDKFWSVGKKFITFEKDSDEGHECAYFPDVEWQATFFKPKQSNTVVVKYLKKALRKVTRYIDGLPPKEVSIHTNLNGQRTLLFSTLLYGKTLLAQSTSKEDFFKIIPQLTFTCDIVHCMDIISKFMYPNMYSHNILAFFILLVGHIKIPERDKNYLFLILYLLKMFALYSVSNRQNFKYFLAFLPRHTLTVLLKQLDVANFDKIIHFFKKRMKPSNTSVFYHLVVILEILASNVSLRKAIKKGVLSQVESECITLVQQIDESFNTVQDLPLVNDLIFIEFRHLPHMIKYYLGNPTLEVDLFELRKLLKD